MNFIFFFCIYFSVDITCNVVEGITNYACRNAYFYCPSGGLCDIDCVTSDACYDTQIYIPDRAYTGLDLYCNDFYNDACYRTDIHCQDNNVITTMSHSASTWSCGTDYECCPVTSNYIECSSGSDCQVFTIYNAFLFQIPTKT